MKTKVFRVELYNSKNQLISVTTTIAHTADEAIQLRTKAAETANHNCAGVAYGKALELSYFPHEDPIRFKIY